MDLHDVVVLSLLPGVSRRRLGEVLRHRASATPGGVASAAGPAPPPGLDGFRQVLRAAAWRPVPREALERAREEADRALARAARCGIVPLILGTPDYPSALATIVDPPLVLWSRSASRPEDAAGGGPAARMDRAVAIVGARAATAYACDVAVRLGTELADRGVTVVSGMARGVDAAAHRGALASAAGWCTVAVLGCGVDVTYPPEHAALAEAVAERGALVSEFPPGTPPRADHFPRRNRVISGLSGAVVVVEASARSGALITADCALDQGREVLAVPGNVLWGRNRGGHALLRDGAKIVEDVDDILEELKVPRSGGSPPPGADTDGLLGRMAPGEMYALEALARASGLEPAVLLPRLLELELAGRVRRQGALFVRRAAAR